MLMKTLNIEPSAVSLRPALGLKPTPVTAGSGMIHQKIISLGRWLLLAAMLSAPTFLSAQEYAIDWYKIAGGGGTSTGGIYTVSGTIGQHDAGGPMTGPGYALSGGFWSLYAIQVPGLPYLVIVRNGANSVKVLWPSPATNTYILQQNASLSTTNWVTSGSAITNIGGTNSITITPPVGNLFFRLKQ